MKPTILLLSLMLPALAGAQALSMSTLQNLPAVKVSVRAITPDGERFGVTPGVLTQVVTDTLKAGGVKVVPESEASGGAYVPVLEITAIINRLSGNGHIYTLRLALREMVVLRRKTANLVDLGAITWERETQGYTSASDRLMASSMTLADRFVTEWREANK